jgi:S1-C subfamily serine protease
MVMPWQNKIQRDSTGSGFISKDRRILTNAHCVANETFLEVRKHGYATKFAARVHHISHESDLAVLMVDDDEFWKDVSPLEFGDLPYLQDGVTVLGYPTGGITSSAPAVIPLPLHQQ